MRIFPNFAFRWSWLHLKRCCNAQIHRNMPIAETPRIETWNSLKYLPTNLCANVNAICTDSSARMNYNSEIFFHGFTVDARSDKRSTNNLDITGKEKNSPIGEFGFDGLSRARVVIFVVEKFESRSRYF